MLLNYVGILLIHSSIKNNGSDQNQNPGELNGIMDGEGMGFN
jgi:hypothetical protein